MALLERLRWNGVAMVEFKRSDADGRLYLMEINPKFWGSLELALVSGVDFPGLVIEELGGPPALQLPRKSKVRFQWVLNGELMHCFERVRDLPATIRDLFRSRTDLRWSDPLPNVVQLLLIFRYLWHRIRGK
jgi:predicted ATP-grasp superfamily ATP-dependent carboligase